MQRNGYKYNDHLYSVFASLVRGTLISIHKLIMYIINVLLFILSKQHAWKTYRAY